MTRSSSSSDQHRDRQQKNDAGGEMHGSQAPSGWHQQQPGQQPALGGQAHQEQQLPGPSFSQPAAATNSVTPASSQSYSEHGQTYQPAQPQGHQYPAGAQQFDGYGSAAPTGYHEQQPVSSGYAAAPQNQYPAEHQPPHYPDYNSAQPPVQPVSGPEQPTTFDPHTQPPFQAGPAYDQQQPHMEAGWAGSPQGGDAFQQPYEQMAAPDHNYDLANYGAAAHSQQPSFAETGYAPAENWNHIPPQQPSHEGYAPAGQPGFDHKHAHNNGTIARQDGDYHDQTEDDEYDDYESQSNTTRYVIIAAAVMSMIVVGAGFTYGYQILFSKPSDETGTPVISASNIPAKVQPADPGGRKFENTDSQLMDRIGNRGQAARSDIDDENSNRVRSVSTLVVGRDGRLIESNLRSGSQLSSTTSPSRPDASSAPASAESSSGIPGMIIEGGVEQPAAPPPKRDAVVQPSQQVVSVPPAATPYVEQSTPPQVASVQPQQANPSGRRRNSKFPPLPELSGLSKPGVDLGPETPVPANNASDTVLGPAQPGVDGANVRQVVAQPPGQAVTGNAGAAAAPNGYVAVLSTKRSRIDALTSFADLQQRYPDILGSKVPDVRRADLTERGLGVMYRAVVGPPGSRPAATQLCARLKNVGYTNCWISPY